MAGSTDNVAHVERLSADNRDNKKHSSDVAEIEKVVSTDFSELNKDHPDFGRLDQEVAKYANTVAIEITPEENKRLKRMIDKRVLPIMIFTYFLQALDKGTMSFASIMGIQDDLGLHGQQVRLQFLFVFISGSAGSMPVVRYQVILVADAPQHHSHQLRSAH